MGNSYGITGKNHSMTQRIKTQEKLKYAEKIYANTGLYFLIFVLFNARIRDVSCSSVYCSTAVGIFVI